MKTKVSIIWILAVLLGLSAFLCGCEGLGKALSAAHQAADPEWYKQQADIEEQRARAEYFRSLSKKPTSKESAFIRFDDDMLLDPNTGELHPILDDDFMLIDLEDNKEYLHFDDDMLLDPETGDLIPILE